MCECVADGLAKHPANVLAAGFPMSMSKRGEDGLFFKAVINGWV